jgi:hypothetical protein
MKRLLLEFLQSGVPEIYNLTGRYTLLPYIMGPLSQLSRAEKFESRLTEMVNSFISCVGPKD